MTEETQEHHTTLLKRASADERYPIDTFTLWDDPERAFHLACTDNHVTGKVKLSVWSEHHQAFMTKTIVGGDPEEFTIEDSLFLQRNW